jgi:hypothetical protein
MTACYVTFPERCPEPATGTGDGVMACVHEHLYPEGDFCAGHWARWTAQLIACSRCYFAPPPDSHVCRLRVEHLARTS